MPTSQSQKRNQMLIALVLVLFLLLSLSQFLTNREAEDSRNEFTDLSGKHIDKIAIEAHQHPKMLFKKLENHWLLVEPFKRLADNSRIQVLLATLSLPKSAVYDSKELDLTGLGLQPPKATLTLNNTAFFFGNKENNNDRRYLQTADKVTLAADIVYPLFSQGTFGFIDKTLVPPGVTHIESDSYTLNKSSQRWQSENHTTEEAQSIVAAWLGQLSEDVVAWPLISESQLEGSTRHRVKFKVEKGDTLNIDIYETQVLSLLHPVNTSYALVITPEQFQNLKVAPN